MLVYIQLFWDQAVNRVQLLCLFGEQARQWSTIRPAGRRLRHMGSQGLLLWQICGITAPDFHSLQSAAAWRTPLWRGSLSRSGPRTIRQRWLQSCSENHPMIFASRQLLCMQRGTYRSLKLLKMLLPEINLQPLQFICRVFVHRSKVQGILIEPCLAKSR